MDFKDISTEEFRTYIFPKGETITITKPMQLHVSKSGYHKIVDSKGLSRIIKPTWLEIIFKADPPFSF
jgi:hypothetical protein